MIGVIHQYVDGSGNWTTLDFDGSTVLSTSAELQTGINRAIATKRPLVVDGSMDFPITRTVTTTFGPANSPCMTFRNVWLKSSALPVLDFDTQYGGNIDWTGRITYTGAGAAWPSAVVRFKPANAIPNPDTDEPYPITKFTNIRLPQIENCGGWVYSVVRFQNDYVATVNNRFKFDQINGNNEVDVGIAVANPINNNDAAFAQNQIDFGLVQGYKVFGIMEGSGVCALPLGTNLWIGSITPSYAGCFSGIETFAYGSLYQIPSISVNGGTLSYGVYFDAGSAKNYVISKQIEGATPVHYGGTGNSVIP